MVRKPTKSNFRQYYMEQTGLKLKRDIHVHHIDMDRSNCDLSNLVHAKAKLHTRYHHLIAIVRMIIRFLERNGYTVEELEESSFLRSSIFIFCPMTKWWDRLYTCERELIKNVERRNRLTGVSIKNVFITEEERRIIDIYKKNN